MQEINPIGEKTHSIHKKAYSFQTTKKFLCGKQRKGLRTKIKKTEDDKKKLKNF